MRRSGDELFFLQTDGREADENESGNEESTRTVAGLGELDIVDQAIFDGWRFLGLDALKILSMTPRELSILMAAQVERHYDEMDREASIAIMRENARRTKRAKSTDLFKRPADEHTAKNRIESLIEKTEHAVEWLSQFEQFSDIGKEGANG